MIQVKKCDTKNEGLPLIKRRSLTQLSKTNKIRQNKNKALVYNARKNTKTVQKSRRR
jgi:hypothetical protein